MEQPPLPSEELYQSWLQDRNVTAFNNALAELFTWYRSHVRFASHPLQTQLENALGAPAFGEPSVRDLARISTTLDMMPIVDKCPVYVLPLKVRVTLVVSAQYLAQGNLCGVDECIVLSNPVSSKVVTHEFSHKHAYALGEAFIQQWMAVNRYEYGIGPREHRDLMDIVWEDDLSSRPKHGFCCPYGRTNFNEDIAEWTTYSRHRHKDLTRAAAQYGFDAEHVAISTAKLQLLVEGGFLHRREADEVVGIMQRHC